MDCEKALIISPEIVVYFHVAESRLHCTVICQLHVAPIQHTLFKFNVHAMMPICNQLTVIK